MFGPMVARGKIRRSTRTPKCLIYICTNYCSTRMTQSCSVTFPVNTLPQKNVKDIILVENFQFTDQKGVCASVPEKKTNKQKTHMRH